MDFFRVSRSLYSLGDEVWEVQIGKNNEFNLNFFKELILNNKEEDIYQLFLNKNNQRHGIIDGYKEAVLESIRFLEYPSLPCRFQNMMVFSTLENAVLFKSKYRAQGIIYQLETKANKSVFTGDMNMLDNIKSFKLSDVKERSRHYWNREMTENPIKEIILDVDHKPLKVVKIL
jgi:hypothetical protein